MFALGIEGDECCGTVRVTFIFGVDPETKLKVGSRSSIKLFAI